MTGEVEAHETSTSMVRAALAEVYAGTDTALKVRVSCPSNCNVRGRKVRIVDDEGAVVKEIELTEFDGAANESDEFVMKAPIQPGQYAWTAVFPAQQREGVLHQESSTAFSFTVKRHSTSIAVWDLPSPIAFGDQFRIKMGVKCSAGCKLTDKKVEIYDHEGDKVASVTLGDVPWPGTTGLYWADVELRAPSIEGFYSWMVEFPKPDLDLPHKEASHKFGFTTARPPEHVVTVEVIDRDTKAPIKNAHVVLHPDSGYPYRGYTDDGGVAKLEVTKGEYKLCASTADYREFQATIEVAGDVEVKAELRYWPAGP